MSILSYGFMQRAIAVAILISIMSPLIGNIIVLKRLSTVGDALSHNSLAGVAIGLCFGINPVLGAVIFSVFAALSIEFIRQMFPKYSEISTSVVMSLGVGLAAIFSGFVSNTSAFGNFLFGSIVAVSTFELVAVASLSIVVIIIMLVLYEQLFYIAFDEEGASLSCINVKKYNLIFTILTAAVVSISARTVGILIISSLMVLPVACAMQVSFSYKSNVIFSVLFALFFTISGLLISYYFNLKPGGTIVIIGILTLLIIIIKKVTFKR